MNQTTHTRSAMRDMKPCQHTLSDDIVYKEVVVIGKYHNIYYTNIFFIDYSKPKVVRILPVFHEMRSGFEFGRDKMCRKKLLIQSVRLRSCNYMNVNDV